MFSSLAMFSYHLITVLQMLLQQKITSGMGILPAKDSLMSI